MPVGWICTCLRPCFDANAPMILDTFVVLGQGEVSETLCGTHSFARIAGGSLHAGPALPGSRQSLIRAWHGPQI